MSIYLLDPEAPWKSLGILNEAKLKNDEEVLALYERISSSLQSEEDYRFNPLFAATEVLLVSANRKSIGIDTLRKLAKMKIPYAFPFELLVGDVNELTQLIGGTGARKYSRQAYVNRLDRSSITKFLDALAGATAYRACRETKGLDPYQPWRIHGESPEYWANFHE